MVKKLTLEKVLNSIEYKMMLELQRVCKEYDMTEDSYFKMTDISGVFWEPFLDRLYKLGVVMKFTKKLKEIKDVPFADLRLDYLLNLYCFGKIMMWKIQGIKDEISGSIVDVKPSGKIVVQAVSGQLCECDIKEIKLIDDF